MVMDVRGKGRMMSEWQSKAVSASEAASHLRSGTTIYVHGAAATPTPLLDALVERAELSDVRLVHMHLEGKIAFAEANCSPRFRSISLFTGAGLREPIAEGRADFVPVF